MILMNACNNENTPKKYNTEKNMTLFNYMYILNECCLAWDQYMVTFIKKWRILL